VDEAENHPGGLEPEQLVRGAQDQHVDYAPPSSSAARCFVETS
jgi:hypothetical protein